MGVMLPLLQRVQPASVWRQRLEPRATSGCEKEWQSPANAVYGEARFFCLLRGALL